MESALIISGSEKSRAALTELVGLCGVPSRMGVRSGTEARRLLSEKNFDLVVINTPLPDEFGTELSLLAAENFAGVLLIVKAEHADEISEKVEEAGVFVIEKPLSRPVFFRTVRIAGISLGRMQGLQQENRKLKDKIEEIRCVDRAKCLLIQFEGQTEAEAHRYIEKQAMNLRLSRLKVAMDILHQYENQQGC